MIMTQNQFIKWIAELQAIAQNGLTYSTNPFDEIRYQSIAKIASEMGAYTSSEPLEIIEEFFAHEKGYATPKLDVRGLVLNEERKILLVQEKSDSCWALPGGYVDVGEAPAEAVIREISEESGYDTRVLRLIALYDKFKHDYPMQLPHTYKAFFLCELIGGKANPDHEISEVGFFSPDALPKLSLHRITASQIYKLLDLINSNTDKTDFD
jgi:ADP-ribose pyrophosphatase YjhB (NUDIX family)